MNDRDRLLNRVRELLAARELDAAQDLLAEMAEEAVRGSKMHPASAAPVPQPPWKVWQDGDLIGEMSETEAWELASRTAGPVALEGPRGCRWYLHEDDLAAAGYLEEPQR